MTSHYLWHSRIHYRDHVHIRVPSLWNSVHAVVSLSFCLVRSKLWERVVVGYWKISPSLPIQDLRPWERYCSTQRSCGPPLPAGQDQMDHSCASLATLHRTVVRDRGLDLASGRLGIKARNSWWRNCEAMREGQRGHR
ncbi:hypothetical protein JB92DRAFT_1626177 [Gautieria morchelliformis]|nr:hypothetical protein JB92DRAFT_1626177 [Gautieria morchelliformis]